MSGNTMLQEIHEFRNLFTFLLMFSSSKNLQSSIYISMSAKRHPHFCLNLTLLASLPHCVPKMLKSKPRGASPRFIWQMKEGYIVT